jgi:hypothetical protein
VSAEPRKARFFAEPPAGLSFPRRGTGGGLLTATKFASTAGGGAKNAPALFGKKHTNVEFLFDFHELLLFCSCFFRGGLL